jgi:hypothetical protein
MGNLREHEVHSAALLGLGFVPGEVHYLASQSQETYEFWRDSRRIPASRLHTNVLDAYDAVGRRNESNNVIVVSPDSHSLAAALVLNKNMTHVVGDFPLVGGPALNGRARFGMSTAFTPMITVSGSGNLFQSLYTMHGTAAADYIGWLISGARNRFREVHFGGPMAALQGGHASYEGVAIDGSENYFKNCVFGTDTIGRDETSPNVTLGAGTLTTFDGCTFLANLTDGDPVFVAVENTSAYTWAQFKNCQFLAFNSNYATQMTVAFKFSGGVSCAMVFDNNCQFQNVAAICDTAYDQYIWLPRQFVSTTDTEGMRSVQLTI